ncbi:CHY zinc finger protein [Agromyces atrinae]|uniref:Putative CHY-type Zn-finger protein n=1 Tax=Agromyces atrinae TaxID=592376 RepID=A0A852SIP7_9MICO|nr:CHY zinc finger protein [Agromyces atrinae]NYD68345.1 putative CHY-type Zn-finger protein [Agromyces atrinae]
MTRPVVLGRTVDDETRCAHYATPLDVVAIKFVCCDTYYPCFECHDESAGHAVIVRPRDRRDEPGILCGACGSELSTDVYQRALADDAACPRCGAGWNPACSLHAHLYFAD